MNDIEFLTYLHEQAEMGLSTLDTVNNLSGIQNDLRLTIESQMLDYKNVKKQAEDKISALGGKHKDLSSMAKMAADAMICAKTMTDRSNTHIAGMVIKGSVNGVIELTQKLNKSDGVSDDVKNLGYKLLLTEERNLDELKRYL